MARGQGAAGHRSPSAALSVAVHDRGQAEAVLEAAAALGLEVELVTAPGLAAFAGVGFCVALEKCVRRPLWIDCGSEPGTALAALRAGARRLLLADAPAAVGKLADIARQLGAELRTRPPAPLLVLGPGENAAAALRRACSPGGSDSSSPGGEPL